MAQRTPEQSVQVEYPSFVHPPFEFTYGRILTMFQYCKF